MLAKEKTIRKFTNLMDGKVIPNVSVKTILDYYEAILNKEYIETKSSNNILDNFREEQIKEMENNHIF